MKKFAIEIRWAIQFSIVSIVWMILEKTLGWHDALIGKQLIYTNLFGLVAIAFYILEIRDKKQNYYLGNITWKQAFLSGAIMTVVIAILSPMINSIIYTWITPHFFENMIEYRVAHQYQTREKAELYFNLHNYIVLGLFDILSKGILTSAIIALFVQTKNKPNEK
jgi:multisubunit Na+/H+ antiporter MnhB subunit